MKGKNKEGIKFSRMGDSTIGGGKGDLGQKGAGESVVKDMEGMPEIITEEEEIKLEDVFEYGIDEIREKIEKHKEMDREGRNQFLFYLPQVKKEIENFSRENPERFRKILKKLKNWNCETDIEINKKAIKIFDNQLSKDLLRYHFLSEVGEFEKINPSNRMQEFVEKVISLNGTIINASEMKNLNDLNLNKEEIGLIERMVEIEMYPTMNSDRVRFIEAIRKNNLDDKEKAIFQTLSNEEKFIEVKKNLKEIKNKFRESNLYFVVKWRDLKIGEKENTEKILHEIENIKSICEYYSLPKIINSEDAFTFANLPENKKEKILSKELREKVKNFKISLGDFWKINVIYSLFYVRDTEKFFSKKEEEIKKILSELGIEKIDFFNFELFLSLSKYLSEEEIDQFSKGDFSGDFRNIKQKLSPFLKNSSFYREISSKFIENIRKTKGDYQARVFPNDLLKYISSSLTFNYLVFRKPGKEILEKLKEKSLKSEVHKKIYNKSNSKVLELNDVIPGRKTTEKILENGNVGYLAAAQKLDIPFDFYGILEKDLEEIKKEVDEKAGELLEDYSQNKEKYLPYLDSLVGYASEYKKPTNEILKIENLWDFKFSHLEDLNSILKEIKDLKIEIEDGKGKEDIGIYIKNLEEHLELEEFTKAKDRIFSIKEENKEKALDLIEKMEKVIKLLKQKEIPEKKDVDILLSNRPVIKHLKLSLTLESIKQTYQKISQKEEKEEFLKSVEILKTPEEYLGAMNIEPSCTQAGKDRDYAALTATQAPVLALGAKDRLERIKGRSLLIPVKDKRGKWRLEMKDTYGVGGEYIKNFANKIEETLKEKMKDYYEEGDEIIITGLIDGKLPPSKMVPSVENLKFWQDGKGEVELEAVKNIQPS